ncbi:MAG: hypothetical protein KF905_11520 [Flavobacteriales bacterium]|nr:hypothetical protein [Flavobacteriales bacterium]
MQRLLFQSLIVLLALPTFGQGLMSRKRPDLIPLDGKARRMGFYLAPGLTYTLPRFKDEEEEVFRSGDTSYTALYDPNGRLGIYLEGGLSWYTRDPVVVDYFDVGLAYKNLRGREAFESTYVRADSTAPFAGEGAFAERLLTFHANANKFIQVADYQFIQLSLGANVDYRLGSSYEHTGDPILNGHSFPPDLITQAHFKLGYGFKVTGSMLIIPAVETPVFSFTPQDQGFGQLQWFSSNYRPLIFSVRFLWLRARSGIDCPPPVRQPGEKRSKRKVYKPDSYHP